MLCRGKLPESTGDTLPAGEILGMDSPGEIWNCTFCKLKEGTCVVLLMTSPCKTASLEREGNLCRVS